MSITAPVETEKPKRSESAGTSITVETPEGIHADTVSAVSGELAKAGHPQSPQQVSADGKANEVLAKIENEEGIGAQVIDIRDRFKKGAENFTGDITGSQHIYGTQGSETGHLTTMDRIAKKVISSGIAEKVRHILFKDKKAA